MEPTKPMRPMTPIEPMKIIPWWPEEWGTPFSSGSAGEIHYAYCPDRHRLVIERAGKRTTFDTTEHQIGGVQQSGTEPLSFLSQHGRVNVDSLATVKLFDCCDRSHCAVSRSIASMTSLRAPVRSDVVERANRASGMYTSSTNFPIQTPFAPPPAKPHTKWTWAFVTKIAPGAKSLYSTHGNRRSAKTPTPASSTRMSAPVMDPLRRVNHRRGSKRSSPSP
jgi:hypothetical protein